MFRSCAYNSNLIYTAEESGYVHRVDLRESRVDVVLKYLVSGESNNSRQLQGVKQLLQPSLNNDSGHFMIVGGASTLDIAEIDLRFVQLERSTLHNAVRVFCPKHVDAHPPIGQSRSDISVSGLAMSQDGHKLVASYQGEQIYIYDYHGESSWRDRKVSGVAWASEGPEPHGPVATLGGHVNHSTFLKTVSFFGPKEEYVLSGCDSGALWIWDSSSGGWGFSDEGTLVHDPVTVVNVLDAGAIHVLCSGV